MRSYGESFRTIRLCVDSFQNGEMAGRYYHPGMAGGGAVFHSLPQFLITMEQTLDAANFPQAYTAKRSFAPLRESHPDAPAEKDALNGALATFSIRLMFRQHASWQGTVTWVEGGGEEPFRSVLELMLLLDSALRQNG